MSDNGIDTTRDAGVTGGASRFRDQLARVLADLDEMTSASLSRALVTLARQADHEAAAEAFSQCDGRHAPGGEADAPAAALPVPSKEAMAKSFIAGMLKLGHTIEEDKVQIFRSRKDGGNALYQLIEAVTSSIADSVAAFSHETPAAPPPVGWRWRSARSEHWTYVDGQPSAERLASLRRFGHSFEHLFTAAPRLNVEIPDSEALLEMARATGLRQLMMGVRATEVRDVLSAFVQRVSTFESISLAA
ncbi:hypothetical protein BSFA1_79920 (plasmid) [Burkholderia sp. SFA1]|nr:hypothetical protein BYI23_E000980 [Burkholderia sp. YI23]BBQ02864.1 hypothetical protein BSFA1_79920 [Burkholderia sp. SFA1]